MSDVAEPRARAAHPWERDEHDFYIEPEWYSRRLFDEERFVGRVYDPACGTGRIVQAARDAGLQAEGGDIVDRNPDFWHHHSDFLARCPVTTENIVSNPPFKHAEAFVRRALANATGKVAMLLPTTWRCGDERSRWLETTPLYRVLDLTPRPSMPPGGGTKDFSWYIWLQGYSGEYRGGWLRRDRAP